MTIGRIPSVEGGIQPTIVDAKGDLIAGVAADSINRLAVGSNDQVLVADSSTSTGLAWKSYGAQFVAGKNKIINGDFGIWQRGTNISLTNGAYVFGPDRFLAYTLFSAGSASFSQQSFTAGTAPVSGYEGTFFSRITNGSTATYWDMHQRIEDVRTFAGQTVTLSFWAKASTTLTARMLISQNFGSGGSADVNSSNVDVALTTAWQRFTGTFTLASIAGKTIGTGSSLRPFLYYHSGTINSTTIDTWGWQLEAGSVATPFTTATGTLQGELAACQRYYYRASGGDIYGTYAFGWATSTTASNIKFIMPVTMRTVPSSIDYASINMGDGVNPQITPSSLTLSSNEQARNIAVINAAGTGYTQYRNYSLLAANSGTAYIGVSAEL